MNSDAFPVAPLAAGGLGLASAALLSEPLRRFALRRSLVDLPDRRKAHRHPTPYLGGVAIAAGTLLPMLVLLPRGALDVIVMLVAATGVFGLGLADDARPLSAALRLGVETAAAVMVVAAGARLPFPAGVFDGAVSVVWIVVLTNAFNLLDNMDGVAAAVGSATSASLAAAAAAAGREDLAVLLSALCAACTGFLFHNWTPARMFMGDAGSLFVGFVIATAAAALLAPCPVPLGLTAAWLIVFVPAADTSLVLLSRRLTRRPLLTGGTDHVSHRLRTLGLSIPQISLTLFAAATATALAGSLVARGVLPVRDVLPPTVAAAAGLTWFMLRIPAYLADDRPAPGSKPHRRHTACESAAGTGTTDAPRS